MSCDPEVFNRGHAILVVGEAGVDIMEAFCERLNNLSDVKFDWHYQGGSAVLLYLGDYGLARKTIEPELAWFSDELHSWFVKTYPDTIRYSQGKRVFLPSDLAGPKSRSIGQVLKSGYND